MRHVKKRSKRLNWPATSDAKGEYTQFYHVLSSETSSRMAQFAAICYFRRLFTEDSNPPPYFNDTMIDILLNVMGAAPEDRSTDERTEAAWTITNLFCAKDLRHTTLEKGALPILVHGIAEGEARFRDQCIWAVGNIAADCDDCRDAVRSTFALELVARQLAEGVYTSAETHKCAIWSSLNTIRGNVGVLRIELQTASHLIDGISRSLKTYPGDNNLMLDSLLALSHLADDRLYDAQTWSKVIDHLLNDARIIDTTFDVLCDASPTLASPALRLLGNIITGSDAQTNRLVTRPRFMSMMAVLMKSTNAQVQREAVWVTSNIVAGPSAHVNLVTTNPELMTMLLRLLHSDDTKLQREVFWTLINLLSSYTVHERPDDLEEFLGYGVLSMTRYLSRRDMDRKTARKAAEVLKPILAARPEWAVKIGEYVAGGDPANPVTALYTPPKLTRPRTEYLLVSYDYYKKE